MEEGFGEGGADVWFGDIEKLEDQRKTRGREWEDTKEEEQMWWGEWRETITGVNKYMLLFEQIQFWLSQGMVMY